MALNHPFELQLAIVGLLATAMRLIRDHSLSWCDPIYRRYSLDYAWHLIMVGSEPAVRRLRLQLLEILFSEEPRTEFAEFMTEYHLRNTCVQQTCHLSPIQPQIEKATRLGRAYDGHAFTLKPPVPLTLRLVKDHECSSHNITTDHLDYSRLYNLSLSAELLYRVMEYPPIQDSVWFIRFNLHKIIARNGIRADHGELYVSPSSIGPCNSRTSVDLTPFYSRDDDDVLGFNIGLHGRFLRTLCPSGLCSTCDAIMSYNLTRQPWMFKKLRMLVLAHHLYQRFSVGEDAWQEMEIALLSAADALGDE